MPDLPKEVPDLKLEVPDRRSGGIRPNLSAALKYSDNTKEAIFSLRIYIIFVNTACARVTKANKMAVSRHVVNATN